MLLTRDRLNLLTRTEIRYVIKNRIKLTRSTTTKDAIMDHVLEYASDDLRYDLNEAIREKVDADLPRKLGRTVTGNRDPNHYMELPD